MRLLFTYFRKYPRSSAITLIALLFSNLAEGIGLSALLPLLNMVVNQSEKTGTPADSTPLESQNEFERTVLEQLDAIGLDPSIGLLLFVIVLAITFKSSLLLVANRYIGYTAAQIATDLRLDMLRKMLSSRWEYYLHQPIGRFTNGLATESSRAAKAFISGTTLIATLIQAIIYTTVALLVSWTATIGALAIGAVILGMLHFLVRMARKAGKNQTKLLFSLITRLTDTMQSIKPLKAMARENLVDTVLEAETAKLNRALQKQVLSSAIMESAQELIFVITIALGMFFALVHWNIPFTTVMVLVILLGRALNQMGSVQKHYQKLMINESAYWSLQKTITQAEQAREDLDGGIPAQLNTGIRLSNVSFAYNERRILNNLSLEIPSGSLTTIIGPSGSGKTTLIDIIIALLRPQHGEVFLDDTPMVNIDKRDWRQKIGYVPQENLLLHDTVLHNVTLGDPTLDESDAEYALRASGAWDFVSAMPEGMSSTAGERGTKLSGGQRQRIMIARALAHRPKLLILDEATSALDPASEAAICKTLQKLRGKLTILAISHQTALVDSADRVYKLENGGAVIATDRMEDHAPT
ncbi:MAG: ABC transporter ATP-binding protein/permease [Gammaproteobacteria bacterium]|jgi:ATP-binding cassette subfamily C protein|nr:ABC transporter ATP-binding protein/permease [Gammaproteobacteria bacterium]